MSKTVERVSLAELNSARSTMPKKEEPVKVKRYDKPTEKIVYTERIKNKDIVDFFTPYGYIEHDRDDITVNPTICVYCYNFALYFDGFTTMFYPTNYGKSLDRVPPPDFDIKNFLEECKTINVTPESVFDAALQERFFNKMPYYIERRQEFTNKNLDHKRNNEVMNNLFKPIESLEKYKASMYPTEKMYGTTDIEKAADTLARLNRN